MSFCGEISVAFNKKENNFAFNFFILLLFVASYNGLEIEKS